MDQPTQDISASTPTVKQLELIERLEAVCRQHRIFTRINPFGAGIANPLSLDIEHDELGNLVGIGLYSSLGEHHYYTEINEILTENLLNSLIIAHNGKGDMEQLRAWGIPVKDEQLIHDTMLIAHVIDSSQPSYGLKDMAKRELGIEYPEYDEIVGKHKGKTKKAPKCPQIETDCCGRVTLDKQPLRLVAAYNALDCYATYKIYERQLALCQKY